MNARRTPRLRAFAARLRGLVQAARHDEPFDDEIQEHLRLLEDRFVAQGMSRGEAARTARRQFGNTTRLREDRRALQTLPSIESLWQDVRYALRTLRHEPMARSRLGPKLVYMSLHVSDAASAVGSPSLYFRTGLRDTDLSEESQRNAFPAATAGVAVAARPASMRWPRASGAHHSPAGGSKHQGRWCKGAESWH